MRIRDQVTQGGDVGTGRILVLRLSSLGDVVLTSSFLRTLGNHFPGSGIDFVVRDDLTSVAALLPDVRRVIAVPRRAGLVALWSLGGRLGREPYDHVFDLHQSLRSRLLVRSLRSQLRPGFSKQSLPRWLLIHTHRNLYERFGGARSLRERMLLPLRQMQLEPELSPTQLVIGESLRRAAAGILQDAGVKPDEPLIGIVPGARWPSKCWPTERFAFLVSRLAAQLPHRFVILGSTAERALAYAVSLGAPERCVDLCGRLDLPEVASVLQKCHAVVTNDSGLMHVAEAVETPVVALFGPTTPEFGYAPYRSPSESLYSPPPCSPCSKNGRRPCMQPTHECMENIDIDEVQATLKRVLARVSATHTRS